MKLNWSILFFMLLLLSCGKSKSKEQVASLDYIDDKKKEEAVVNYAPPVVKGAPTRANMASESDYQKQIVRSAEISIMSENIKDSKIAIDALLKKYTGYYDSENFSDNQSLNYELELRIPASKFDIFLNDISQGKDKLTEKDITATDVTADYYDLKSRINTKKIYLARYNELAKKAKSVDEILKIEDQTRELIEDMESSEQEFKIMSKRISMSNIKINIEQKKAGIGGELGFWKQFSDSVSGGVVLLKTIFFFLISIWPIYFIIGIFIFAVRKFKRKNKKKK